jgi:hypothetical protein
MVGVKAITTGRLVQLLLLLVMITVSFKITQQSWIPTPLF